MAWVHLRQTVVLGAAATAIIWVSACAADGPLGRLVQPASPYDRYLAALRESGLDQTALGRDWTKAGQTSLQQPSTASLPLREEGYFAAESPAALAYRFDLQRGRRLSVDVILDSTQLGRLFLDLFELRDGATPRLVASLSPGTNTLTYEVRHDAAFVLRIQPELLRGGRFTVVQRTLSSLVFPVAGLSAAAVQSAFGAARNGGTREHEGIDIFAARGTAAVAVVDGVAQTGTNPLGGNVVWLQDRQRGLAFYYAHLDRWAFDRAAAVRAGEVLGYVGNTGNARTTAPHLHFGVYERGAIDPLPFVQPDDSEPAPPAAPAKALGTMVRTTGTHTWLRSGIEAGSPTRMQLTRSTLAQVIGASRSSLRVVLPDGTSGYVGASAVRAADEPMRRQRLEAGSVLRDRPLPQAPAVSVLAGPLTVAVLGRFGGYEFVRGPEGQSGWVEATGG